ncbi:MAG: hypothetical protein MR938_06445 [Tenericutes bacterium]|nr:hypothetical protein [Mycoplasmatota bacterium]
MNKEELIIGFFEKGYCCNLDEVKNTCLGLLKENQELKRQIEDISEELELVRCDLHNRISERDSYERELNECLSQQKEFIEYLEDLIKQNETVVEVSKYGLPKNCSKLLINFYKEIFSKYQEIIGGNKDEK